MFIFKNIISWQMCSINQSINQLMFIQKADEVGVEPEQNLIICDDYYERPPDTGKK